jgi:hypothetical protein
LDDALLVLDLRGVVLDPAEAVQFREDEVLPEFLRAMLLGNAKEPEPIQQGFHELFAKRTSL